ncbi:MAG TPA: flagellar biosynthesis anti-sigma factor FlgM [Verrucomicrobiae bacterium]|jgi:hypothetical protein|nr:flagellar biosynthesis anti-sigma factor FlgM [Verrucomicrobiae bacterium]
MKGSEGEYRHRHRRIRVQRPAVEHGEDEGLWEEVRKYAKLIPSEPDPNMGRTQEIREEIQNGTYLTPEVMEETVARLVIRFMTKE